MQRTPARLRRTLLLAAVGAAALAPVHAQDADAGLPMAELNIGIHLIHAEVADNDARRMRGLMFRRELIANHGMLFIFDETERQCMWMRNTYIPLSVAFLDESGAVINVEEMKPQTDDTHCATRPARYALEMTAGWFAQHGGQPGTVIQGVVPVGRR